MKKVFAIFILLFISLSLWAQEEDPPNDSDSPGLTWEDAPNESAPPGLTWDDDEPAPPPKKKFAIKNRIFELSLVNLDFSVSNSFLAASDVINNLDDMIQTEKFFKDSISINLNDFFKGFSFNFGVIIKPISLNFNWKDKWGFGLDIGHTNVTGNLQLSGNLLSFNEVDNDRFGVGAAVFTDFGIPVFFHFKEFKIKIRPSVFLPVVYTEPNITYSYRQVTNEDGISGMRLEVNYDIRVYSVVDMRGIIEDNDFGAIGQNLQDNAWDIAGNNLGYDFSLGGEYPLFDWLDLGVDIINIPLVMATLNNYMQVTGEAYFDSSKINIDGMNGGKLLEDDAFGYPDPEKIEIKYNNNGSKKIYRPFTMLFYAKYRPCASTPGFSLIPSLGFSLSPLYAELASIEGGLSVRFDLANIFIATIGINYNDRRWKNSLDFVFNLRAFEIDFGISFQSSDFVKSFQGAGVGVTFGLKLGW
jgi:hypothetical protein